MVFQTRRCWTPGRTRWSRELWTWCTTSLIPVKSKSRSCLVTQLFFWPQHVFNSFVVSATGRTCSCVLDPSWRYCGKTLRRNCRAAPSQTGRTPRGHTSSTDQSFSALTFNNPLSNRKLFLYSVHDTTLIPCLMALGIFDMRWPQYAADITLELHQNRPTSEAFVKVSYAGQVSGKMLNV